MLFPSLVSSVMRTADLEHSQWDYVCFDFIKRSLVLPQTSQYNCCRFSFMVDAELCVPL